MGVAESILNKLLQLAERKNMMMNEIHEISKRLADAADNWEELQKLLNARQAYMDKIDRLDADFDSLKQKVVAEAGVGSWEGLKKIHPHAVQAIENKLQTAAETARKAHKLSVDAQLTAEAKLKELQMKFKKLQSTKVGIGAYQKKNAQYSGYFIDKKK